MRANWHWTWPWSWPLVTKMRFKELPKSDRGDFGCRRAVDSSSYLLECIICLMYVQNYNSPLCPSLNRYCSMGIRSETCEICNAWVDGFIIKLANSAILFIWNYIYDQNLLGGDLLTDVITLVWYVFFFKFTTFNPTIVEMMLGISSSKIIVGILCMTPIYHSFTGFGFGKASPNKS